MSHHEQAVLVLTPGLRRLTIDRRAAEAGATSSYHSACSRLIRNISKIQSQLKNDMNRTERFRI
eukprot:COSAG01_NODE_46376_length_400_cov_4.641196_1_plen_63_part_01